MYHLATYSGTILQYTTLNVPFVSEHCCSVAVSKRFIIFLCSVGTADKTEILQQQDKMCCSVYTSVFYLGLSHSSTTIQRLIPRLYCDFSTFIIPTSRAFQPNEPAAPGGIERDEMQKAVQDEVTKSLSPTNLLLEQMSEMIAKIVDGRNAEGGRNTEIRRPADEARGTAAQAQEHSNRLLTRSKCYVRSLRTIVCDSKTL